MLDRRVNSDENETPILLRMNGVLSCLDNSWFGRIEVGANETGLSVLWNGGVFYAKREFGAAILITSVTCFRAFNNSITTVSVLQSDLLFCTSAVSSAS